MVYVLDTNVLIVLFTYFYESRFPTLWENFHRLVADSTLVSVREVLNEVRGYHGENRLTNWASDNHDFFLQPTDEEIPFIEAIFGEQRFQALISQKSLLQGNPVADPFLVDKAKALGGCVVTLEEYKENGVKIPNVREFLDVSCTNLEGFMEQQNWTF